VKKTLNLLISLFLLGHIAIFNNCKEKIKTLPELVTVPATTIQSTTAVLGGQIANDGGAEIIAKGVCWGTEPEPDISESITINGEGTGSFTSILAGLNPNTLYYARAYATNSEGTAYGGEVHFTTSTADAPAVVTYINIADIYYFSARVEGHVTSDGGAPVTEKGICWATSENPTIINNEKVISHDNSPDYSCNVSPLNPGTVYFARAYAINSVDTSYGDNVTIKTPAAPEVTTVAATDISPYAATVSGNVTTLGAAENFEIGICYGTHIDPTIDGLHIVTGNTGTGEFTCNLTNLTPGTLYYARAYASWPLYPYTGLNYTVYGNGVSFTTGNP
jgi:hypothetical protein